jgi:electron transfer flavoprotein alpha subunit
MSQIIVLAEQQPDGSLVKATLNAIGAAQVLASKINGAFDIAVVGENVSGLVNDLQGYGAAQILVAQDAALAGYTAQAYAQAFSSAVQASGAKYVIAASTSRGKDTTPRVAGRLKAGQASDIIAIEGDASQLVYVRPMWAGNIIGKVVVNTPVSVLTIRPTDFALASKTGAMASVQNISAGIDQSSIRMKYVGLESVKSDRPALSDADVVVSGGRGLKDADQFNKVLTPLADTLSAAIGASRAVVDAGWVPNDWQVGQTGKVVAPKLYVALGISGAIQHLAGMKGSKTIVAVNKDADAPIFQVADYGLVQDLFTATPEMVEKIKAVKG